MDNKIVANYKLWPNNYIAYDILNSTDEYASEYTQQEKEAFEQYMAAKLEKVEADKDELREIFLSIYANPVVGKKNL